MKESGTLESSLALVDVSGSMGAIHDLPKKKARVEPIFPGMMCLLAQCRAAL